MAGARKRGDFTCAALQFRFRSSCACRRRQRANLGDACERDALVEKTIRARPAPNRIDQPMEFPREVGVAHRNYRASRYEATLLRSNRTVLWQSSEIFSLLAKFL